MSFEVAGGIFPSNSKSGRTRASFFLMLYLKGGLRRELQNEGKKGEGVRCLGKKAVKAATPILNKPSTQFIRGNKRLHQT